MDAQGTAILNQILSDLRYVENEMQNAANELKGIKGIGAELCAYRLEVLSDKYEKARRELQKIS